MSLVKSNLVKIVTGSALSLASLVPAFADTTNLKYQANVQNVLSISIENAKGDTLAKDGGTAVLNFGNVDAFGLNVSSSIDSVKLVKDKNLYAPGEITDNESALYVIGSDTAAPTVNLRSRIQGGGGGKIEHTFQSDMDGMSIVFAQQQSPWGTAKNFSDLDPQNKMVFLAPGAAPMTIAGPNGAYKDSAVYDNEIVDFDIGLNVTPKATTGSKSAVSTFRLLPI
jgi:hypothetical protein